MSERPKQTYNQGCLWAILRLLGFVSSGPTQTDSLPYRRRDDFLSAAEAVFFRALLTAAPEEAVILAKVRISDLLYVVDQRSNFGSFNRISAKHVDFVILDKRSLEPRAAIELDDSSHRREDRRSRDAFVEAAFEAAGLPLLRFPVSRSYDIGSLGSRISDVLATRSLHVAPPPQTLSPVATLSGEPSCPKCGVLMIQRIATRGANAGQPFWGCVNYPRCRATAPVR